MLGSGREAYECWDGRGSGAGREGHSEEGRYMHVDNAIRDSCEAKSGDRGGRHPFSGAVATAATSRAFYIPRSLGPDRPVAAGEESAQSLLWPDLPQPAPESAIREGILPAIHHQQTFSRNASSTMYTLRLRIDREKLVRPRVLYMQCICIFLLPALFYPTERKSSDPNAYRIHRHPVMSIPSHPITIPSTKRRSSTRGAAGFSLPG